MSAEQIEFSEAVRFRDERGLTRAVAEAARRSRNSSAEYMRRALRERVTADGVIISPLGPDDGPADLPAAPVLRRAT